MSAISRKYLIESPTPALPAYISGRPPVLSLVTGREVSREASARTVFSSRLRHRQRFTRLIERPGISAALGCAAQFVERCLPAARANQGQNWSLACLPNGFGSSLLVSIRVGHLEVFRLLQTGREYCFAIRMHAGGLQATYGRDLRRFQLVHPVTLGPGSDYSPAQADQLIELSVRGARNCSAILHLPSVTRSLSVLTGTLLIAGHPVEHSQHCYDLLEYLLGSPLNQARIAVI